ncbi:MAG: AmmeMemoRadiSam system protein A [Patescibacteria group bacterium]|jgi:AmmeMemoRadiSam system protein A|nr:AmmeMemoRadiSam system protein A [Patescibacteria group bacterium]
MTSPFLKEKEKRYLLSLARESIKYFLKNNDLLQLSTEEIKNLSPNLKEKRATFVTLTENGHLRGCIGHLEAIQPLFQDIIENSVNAAFFDFRFFPVNQKELEKIKIEVSILTPPQELQYKNPSDLLNLIRPHIDGVILQKDFYQATYLPQVWEEIPDKEEFLSSLALKAGLPSDVWKKEKIDIKIYQVESFKE